MLKSTKSFSRATIIYVFTTIFLGVLGVYTYTQIEKLILSSEMVYHANEVNEKLQKISESTREVKINRLGYLIAGDTVYKNEAQKILGRIVVEMESIDLLLQDPDQTLNFKKLQGLLIQEVTNLERVQEARNAGTLTIEEVNHEIHRSDELFGQIEKMSLVEKQVYDSRRKEYARLSNLTSVYIITLFLGALIILTVAYFKTTNTLDQSQLLRAELLFQSEEKERRAAELFEANNELLVENEKKEKLAADFIIANRELLFQNSEKEKRAAELIVANNELLVENEKKEKLAAEFIIANKELLFQNSEKEKRAAELIVANNELLIENEKKEKLAAEFIIANKELLFQNSEKEKRAAELIVANNELLYQNEEREKRAAELSRTNKELQLFVHISSHDLQEPIRKIQMSASRISENDLGHLSEKGQGHFKRMQEAALGMQTLVEDLEKYSRTNSSTGEAEYIELVLIVNEVENEFRESMDDKNASIDASNLGSALVVAFQFKQMIHNLVGNALKFSKPGVPTSIVIDSEIIECDRMFNGQAIPIKEYTHIKFIDNGIGFEPEYGQVIFEVFQRLHGKDEFKGSGIGLAIVKKIVENQDGFICATGVLNEGARFDIYFPTKKIMKV